MKRLDDIRGTNQPAQLRKRKPLPPQPTLQIKRPTRMARPHKFPKLTKHAIRFIWKHKTIIASLVIIALIGVMIMIVIEKKESNMNQEPTRAELLREVIITDDTKLVVDFTFNLKMVINNQPQAIPANYGKTEQQKLIFNTDTSSGDIHVQSPNKDKYKLSDFFVLWGSQFNSKCLLNHCIGSSGSLTMTVNGKINPAFDSYIIKPGDQIIIVYNDRPL